jgi:proteic killer suppression protein
MIKSFDAKDTRKIFKGGRVKNLPREIQHSARLKLRMLNNSFDLSEFGISGSIMQNPPGGLNGTYTIILNDRWSILFKWDGRNANEVRITGYDNYLE